MVVLLLTRWHVRESPEEHPPWPLGPALRSCLTPSVGGGGTWELQAELTLSSPRPFHSCCFPTRTALRLKQLCVQAEGGNQQCLGFLLIHSSGSWDHMESSTLIEPRSCPCRALTQRSLRRTQLFLRQNTLFWKGLMCKVWKGPPSLLSSAGQIFKVFLSQESPTHVYLQISSTTPLIGIWSFLIILQGWLWIHFHFI